MMPCFMETYSIIVPTEYGQMIVNRHDHNQTNALFKTSVAAEHQEIMLLLQIMAKVFEKGEPTLFDVGANFGTFSIALAPYCKEVHAFEPQRIIYNMLCGSIALNAYENVYAYNMAVGELCETISLPKFDYHKPMNFGSIEFGESQTEKLDQERGVSTENVRQINLNRFYNTFGCFSDKCDVLKIDAEGMGMSILGGGDSFVMKYQPIIFMELLKENREDVMAFMADNLYTVYELGINALCVPAKFEDKIVLNIKREENHDE